jgi:thioredoxin reductase
MAQGLYDCIVIGAGPAGLSASLFLARYRRRVLTLHHNSPRNIYSHGIHGFLGHHNIKPTELLARGQSEVTIHGGEIIEACATRLENSPNGWFKVVTSIGNTEGPTFETRRLLLATGLRDLTPDCPGFREFYGSSVYHCPDCDGFEVTDKRVAVLSHGQNAVGFALNLLTWTDKLTLLTDGHAADVNAEHRAKLNRLDISLREEPVVALEGDIEAGQIQRVRFATGPPLLCEALFFNLGTQPASNLHEMLGCKLTDDLVWVDQTQQTSVAGVYAAGDITPNSQLAIVAASEGAMAAIHIHRSLIPSSQQL